MMQPIKLNHTFIQKMSEPVLSDKKQAIEILEKLFSDIDLRCIDEYIVIFKKALNFLSPFEILRLYGNRKQNHDGTFEYYMWTVRCDNIIKPTIFLACDEKTQIKYLDGTFFGNLKYEEILELLSGNVKKTYEEMIEKKAGAEKKIKDVEKEISDIVDKLSDVEGSKIYSELYGGLEDGDVSEEALLHYQTILNKIKKQ